MNEKTSKFYKLLEDVAQELFHWACGPDSHVKWHSGIIVNFLTKGYGFNSKVRQN